MWEQIEIFSFALCGNFQLYLLILSTTCGNLCNCFFLFFLFHTPHWRCDCYPYPLWWFFSHTLKVLQVTRQFLTVRHFFIFTGCILSAKLSYGLHNFHSCFWKLTTSSCELFYRINPQNLCIDFKIQPSGTFPHVQ